MDDIKRLKGRMAEALVEGIFKRAQYVVARVARETQVSALMRTGRNVPDFVVWRALDEPSLGHRSYLLLAIEVKYCADLEDHPRRAAPARSPEVALQWPELYEILVTDRPEPGRSCFQATHVSILPPAAPPATLDLHLVPGLDIYRRTVEEYEGLVREVFPIIGSRSDAQPSSLSSSASPVEGSSRERPSRLKGIQVRRAPANAGSAFAAALTSRAARRRPAAANRARSAASSAS
ncbi:MAG: hypothetical protein ACREJS_13475 [Candidatus Rokuibacteriota bacterium]